MSQYSNTKPVNLTGSNQAVVAAPADYRGFAVRETSGTAGATIVLYDSASSGTGLILDEISLVAGESARELYPLGGVDADNGIYAVVTGSVAGSIRVGA